MSEPEESDGDNYNDARCECGAGPDEDCATGCTCKECEYARYLDGGDPRSADDFDGWED